MIPVVTVTGAVDSRRIVIVRLLPPAPSPNDVGPRGASAAVPDNVKGWALGDARGDDRAGGDPMSETMLMAGRPAAGVMTAMAVVTVMVMLSGCPTLPRPQASGGNSTPLGGPAGPPRLMVVRAALAKGVMATVTSLQTTGFAPGATLAPLWCTATRRVGSRAVITGAAPGAVCWGAGLAVGGGTMPPSAACALHLMPCQPPFWPSSPWL